MPTGVARRWVVVGLACLWGLSCRSGAPPAAAPAPAPPGPLARALEEARRSPELRGQLVVEAEGRLGEGMSALLLFGDGVGVVNGVRQIRVPEEVLAGILDLLLARDVASWPTEATEPEGYALEVRLRLTVAVGEVTHTVVERNRRPPRPSLHRLLEELVQRVRPFVAEGVEVASLAEGLRLVAEGRLAPQVLTCNALAPRLPGGSGEEGWQLRLQRGVLSALSYEVDAGVRELSRRRPSPAEVAELAAALLRGGAAQLPGQVSLPQGLFQLHLEILGHRLHLQARPFGAPPAGEDPRARSALEALRTHLRGLFAREVGGAGPPTVP